MATEAVLIAALLSFALLPIIGFWGRVVIDDRLGRTALVAFWLTLPGTLIWSALTFSRPVVERVVPDNRPIEVDTDGYLGSESCKSCHPHEHGTWYRSYHRTMTQLATPETVMAPFDNVTLEDGVSFRTRRRGDQFSVELPTGEERPIVMVTGSHHLQVYWFAGYDRSRYLGLLPFAYLKEAERWLPTRSTFLRPPEMSEEAGVGGRWNRGCIECHAVNGKMRPSIMEDGTWWSDTVDTQVAELGIACEACHGPGAEHVRANRDPTRRYKLHFGEQADETIVNPSRLPNDRSSQVCGQCHGVMAISDWQAWALDGADYRPGDDLSKAEIRFLIRQNADVQREDVLRHFEKEPDYLIQHFWSDGMIRIAGREYNGLVETPCFQAGEMSCLSCHQMHQDGEDPRAAREWANDQLRLGMESNQACLQCHRDFESAEALTAHTYHLANSSGSNCYNCHMSYTTYGLLKAIRSHQIDSPNVATSLETGRPNACNQCHLDKTLAWTAEKLSEWYGRKPPELSEDERSIAASVLWLLRGDAAQRALMAWSFGWQEAKEVSGTHWMAPYLIQLLKDPYDAVRYIAARSLRQLRGFEEFAYEWPVTEQRQEQVQLQGMAIWRQRPPVSSPRAVLIDEHGELLEDPFLRLLQQRNDRPVYVAE